MWKLLTMFCIYGEKKENGRKVFCCFTEDMWYDIWHIYIKKLYEETSVLSCDCVWCVSLSSFTSCRSLCSSSGTQSGLQRGTCSFFPRGQLLPAALATNSSSDPGELSATHEHPEHTETHTGFDAQRRNYQEEVKQQKQSKQLTHFLVEVLELLSLDREGALEHKEGLEFVTDVDGAVKQRDVHESSAEGEEKNKRGELLLLFQFNVYVCVCVCVCVWLLYLISSAWGTEPHTSTWHMMSVMKSFSVNRLWRLEFI